MSMMTEATLYNRVAVRQKNKESYLKLNSRVRDSQLKMVIVYPAQSAGISHVRSNTNVEQSLAILNANQANNLVVYTLAALKMVKKTVKQNHVAGNTSVAKRLKLKKNCQRTGQMI